MSNEQNDNDALVSSVYRETAQEKTPPELDCEILRMAENSETDMDVSLYPTWMRPAAWAATVGLSLAIVFEVTQVGEIDDVAVPASVAVEAAFSPAETSIVDEAEAMARVREGQDQGVELAKSRAEPLKRKDADLIIDIPANRARSALPSVAQQLSAEEFAEKKETADDNSTCEAPIRDNADEWFDCITDMREAGREADAESEMLKLIEEFPEFQPNK